MLKKLLVTLLLSLTLTILAETNISFKTNNPIKVYINNKLINSDFYLKRKIKPGDYEIKVCTEDEELLNQTNVSIAKDDHLIYNYRYQSKKDLTIKSAIVPSRGQFLNERYIEGGIIAGATIGCASYIMLQYGKFTSNDEKYDKERNLATPNYKSLNIYKKNCDDAKDNIAIGSGLLGLVYLYNIADAYFFTKEHKVTINKSNININPIITSLNKNTAIGFAINF